MFVVLGCFSVDVKVGYQKDFKAFEGVQDLLFCFSRLILPPHPLLINSVCVCVCVCVLIPFLLLTEQMVNEIKCCNVIKGG